MSPQLKQDLETGPGLRLPAPKVCRRFGVTGRTLDRWLANENLQFPRPLVINNRRYFDEAEIIAWERARAARAA